ncbi:hypothetical protein [Archangium primigenium]|uniref:hypothetical protein n=1 Tax=[Archangium] primigenium TaxID=2792470 RepID=UPI00195E6A98|nr:hypothetical protein [Archangium primigenium]MBM7117640.1 hypothetical protein [Archangium primigenium]
MRIARQLGWTEAEAFAQPLEYLYLLAADAQLENEAVEAAAPRTPPGSAPRLGGGSSATRERVVSYSLKPRR